MKTATVTEAKNGLSALLDRVKAGESVVITERGVPVAVLEPAPGRVDLGERIARLERTGAIRAPRSRSGLERVLHTPPPRLDRDADAVAIVIEERESGR